MVKSKTVKGSDKLKLIQKAIMTGIGATASKETIRKTAVSIMDDVQDIVSKLLRDLESTGELKAKETKKIIKELQKKSEMEKKKIYNKLKKEGKSLFKSTKEIVMTPMSVLKEISSTLSKANGTNKNKSGRRSAKKRKKRR